MSTSAQLPLISVSTDDGPPEFDRFPKTRYLGSKRKLLPLLHAVFSSLEFETALDPFSGTGSVAYLLKTMGKSVTAADAQRYNVAAARALVENQSVRISEMLPSVLARVEASTATGGFVEREFEGRFFLPDENRFIDRCLPEIERLSGYSRDSLLFVLGQACLSKRPYNLFHRANLNMRSRDVKRSFGNKATWDKPFAEHMTAFAAQTDRAVFEGAPAKAVHADVFSISPTGYDLVYLDPPYISGRGTGVDYADYYHFLDGLAEPDSWPERILRKYKHRPTVERRRSPFCDAERIGDAFRRVIDRFSDATLVISYRSDGIPSTEEISGFMKAAGKQVELVDAGKYTYALSTNRASREVVLIGR